MNFQVNRALLIKLTDPIYISAWAFLQSLNLFKMGFQVLIWNEKAGGNGNRNGNRNQNGNMKLYAKNRFEEVVLKSNEKVILKKETLQKGN